VLGPAIVVPDVGPALDVDEDDASPHEQPESLHFCFCAGVTLPPPEEPLVDEADDRDVAEEGDEVVELLEVGLLWLLGLFEGELLECALEDEDFDEGECEEEELEPKEDEEDDEGDELLDELAPLALEAELPETP
jgi:hypothetical protein